MQTLLLLRCLNPTWTVGLNHWSFASKEHGNSWNGQLWLMRPLTSSLFIASQPKKRLSSAIRLRGGGHSPSGPGLPSDRSVAKIEMDECLTGCYGNSFETNCRFLFVRSSVESSWVWTLVVGAELAVQPQQRRTTVHDNHSCSQHCGTV